MKILFFKMLTVSLWIGAVFGITFVLQKSYENEASFKLFVYVALSLNVAYDGIKLILKYPAKNTYESYRLFNYVVGASCSFLLAFISIGTGVATHIYWGWNEIVGQIISVTGYLVFFILAMKYSAMIERLLFTKD